MTNSLDKKINEKNLKKFKKLYPLIYKENVNQHRVACRKKVKKKC